MLDGSGPVSGTEAGTGLDGFAWALFRDRYLPRHKHLPARPSPLELTTNQRAGSLNLPAARRALSHAKSVPRSIPHSHPTVLA